MTAPAGDPSRRPERESGITGTGTPGAGSPTPESYAVSSNAGDDSPRPADRPAASPSAAPRPLDLTIRDAQRTVDTWIRQFDEGYWPPLANLARLVEEVGELSRELNHRYGPKPKKADEPEQDLALELGDILFVVIALANEQRIDLEDAFARVLEKYEVRDASRWRRKGERGPSVRGDRGSLNDTRNSG